MILTMRFFRLKEASYEELWKLCAGPLTDIPQVGEKVFYFPQGHLEHVEVLTNQVFDQGMIPHFNLPSQILCRVVNIQLLVEPETDEIYASITMLPDFESNPKVPDPNPPETPKQELQSFCKILTASDISKHEGVVVLQKHAARCLPQLDMTQKNPTQELVARDLHGFEWKFKHVYKDQANTHLLTTGWSNFVSSKRLNAGDALLFLRGPNDNDLWCGVKHLTRQQSPVQSSVISSQCMHLGVLSTASHAIMTGSMFVVYYKPRISQFIVRLNKYLEAVNKNFSVGMPFMMRFEGHNSLEILRFSGTIVGVGDFSPAWHVSQWKSLKVQCHEPAAILRPERISLWEIEPFSPSMFANTSRLTVVKNRRLRPVNISSFGIASSSTTSPPLNTNSSSRMRVDGIWPNSPLLRVSSSFAYEPRNNEISTSTQASVSGHAPFSRRLNNGEHDEVENEDEYVVTKVQKILVYCNCDAIEKNWTVVIIHVDYTSLA
ncbi:hypothetical protein K1719_024655 [Acacia pycnantha]|nr:hypothetical protein K1719_024655 [Acacia pycnantha]